MRATPAMHQKARADATTAFANVLGAPPSANELRFLLAEGLYDSTYGAGWHDDGVGSFNMGAIHAYPAWKGETFTYTDSHPDGTRYTQTFKAYPSAVDGWADLVHEFYVRRPAILAGARAGSPRAVATAMVQTGYAEGFGATEEERIAGWEKALRSCLDEIDSQQGRNMPAITIRAQNPLGENIGTTTVSDLDSPGLSPLTEIYGAPVMVVYPNGWRFLKFTPEIQIPVKSGHPYTPIEQQEPVNWSWQSGAAIGIMGIAVTILVGTLQIKR